MCVHSTCTVVNCTLYFTTECARMKARNKVRERECVSTNRNRAHINMYAFAYVIKLSHIASYFPLCSLLEWSQNLQGKKITKSECTQSATVLFIGQSRRHNLLIRNKARKECAKITATVT